MLVHINIFHVKKRTTRLASTPSLFSAWYSWSEFCTGTFQSFSPHMISVGVVTLATLWNGEIASHVSAGEAQFGLPDLLVHVVAVVCANRKNSRLNREISRFRGGNKSFYLENQSL